MTPIGIKEPTGKRVPVQDHHATLKVHGGDQKPFREVIGNIAGETATGAAGASCDAGDDCAEAITNESEPLAAAQLTKVEQSAPTMADPADAQVAFRIPRALVEQGNAIGEIEAIMQEAPDSWPDFLGDQRVDVKTAGNLYEAIETVMVPRIRNLCGGLADFGKAENTLQDLGRFPVFGKAESTNRNQSILRQEFTRPEGLKRWLGSDIGIGAERQVSPADSQGLRPKEGHFATTPKQVSVEMPVSPGLEEVRLTGKEAGEPQDGTEVTNLRNGGEDGPKWRLRNDELMAEGSFRRMAARLEDQPANSGGRNCAGENNVGNDGSQPDFPITRVLDNALDSRPEGQGLSASAVPGQAVSHSPIPLTRDESFQAVAQVVNTIRLGLAAHDGLNGQPLRQLKIRLYPGSLGEVDVTLRHSHRAVEVQLRATSAAVASALQSAQDELMSALAELGLDVAGVSIDVRWNGQPELRSETAMGRGWQELPAEADRQHLSDQQQGSHRKNKSDGAGNEETENSRVSSRTHPDLHRRRGIFV
jgi:hypothetical protein